MDEKEGMLEGKGNGRWKERQEKVKEGNCK